MLNILKQSLWKQFGASIDMLKNAITVWPEEYWSTNKKFFYNAYHCLVFLDYYLTVPPEGYSTPLPFTLTEPGQIPTEAVDDVVPDRIYSREELLAYLQSTREKCRALISGLTEEKLSERWIYESENMCMELSGSDALQYSVLEILFYNMRHVQHHAAQLNLLLRQQINNAPDYVSNVRDEL